MGNGCGNPSDFFLLKIARNYRRFPLNPTNPKDLLLHSPFPISHCSNKKQIPVYNKPKKPALRRRSFVGALITSESEIAHGDIAGLAAIGDAGPVAGDIGDIDLRAGPDASDIAA